MAIHQHQFRCKYCNKKGIEKSHKVVGGEKYITLECGHTITEKQMVGANRYEITSKDGRGLYEFQKKSVEFVEKSNASCLIAHEMGLGKTVISLATLKLHPELFPVAIVCKSGLKTQWFQEVIRWLDGTIPQIITSSKDKPFYEFFKIFIVGGDMLRNIDWLEQFNVKTVITDEVQQFKNLASARTTAWRKLTKDKEHNIALSGTAVENGGEEYFPVLNVLRPEIFHSHRAYVTGWCDYWTDGFNEKIGGIAADRIDEFKDITKEFILRYKMDEVMPDMPQISINYQYHELGKEVERAYKIEFQKFEEYMETETYNHTTTIGFLSRMRHLTGIAKVDPIVDFAVDFLFQTDRKLAIFIHHKNVMELLKAKLGQLCAEGNFQSPVVYSADQDQDQRAETVRRFKEEARIGIFSTLAAGEGLNLQFCSDFILGERQWNPSKEAQVGGRFKRIGQTRPILGTYMTAIGTIDEMLMELVARKEQFVKATLDGEVTDFKEENHIRELADMLFAKGRKRWGK